MSEAAVSRGSGNAVIRVLLLGVFAVSIVAEVAVHHRDRQERIPIEAFTREFTIDARYPQLVDAVRLAPSSDEAASVASGAAVQDALGSIRLADLDEPQRLAWIDALGRLDPELEHASVFARDAIRRRPGWPAQMSWYGLLEYARSRRALTLADTTGRWLVPLRAAHDAGPGDLAITTSAASAALEAWPLLDGKSRALAAPLWAPALADGAFAEGNYAALSDTIGFDAAIRALPPVPAALKAAVRAHAEVGDTRNASRLYSRWLEVERASRRRDLAKLEQRERLYDVVGLRNGVRAWAQAHPAFELDDAEGRKQSARVLELWPPERGTWRWDPRAAMVMFFVERQVPGAGPGVQRAAESLSDIPLPILGRARLMGGDTYEAETLATGGDSAGGFEWTSFHVDVARGLLARGDAAAAGEALGRVAPAARDECDVTVLRASIERALGRVEVVDPRVILREYPPSMWSKNRVAICIDPAAGLAEFRVWVVAETEALVTSGFDGGRNSHRLVPAGAHVIDVPLEGRGGRHVMALETISGGPVKVSASALQ
jgi:hypothetical protein